MVEQYGLAPPDIGKAFGAIEHHIATARAFHKHQDFAVAGKNLRIGEVERLLQHRAWRAEAAVRPEARDGNDTAAAGIGHVLDEEPGLALANEHEGIGV